MQVGVEELDSESFTAFGRVVDAPSRDPDAADVSWRWWAQTALLARSERPYAVGYLELEAGRPAFGWAERHAESEEMVIPLNGELLVYAASPEPKDFRVFRVRPGQAVVIGKGVWHGAPLAPAGAASAVVLLAERTGELDTDKVQFEELTVDEGL